jgi:hypothetical protein
MIARFLFSDFYIPITRFLFSDFYIRTYLKTAEIEIDSINKEGNFTSLELGSDITSQNLQS